MVSVFPTDESVLKQLYLALNKMDNADPKRETAMSQFMLVYEELAPSDVVAIYTYMDAPCLPDNRFAMARTRLRLQPYIRALVETVASVPDGIRWPGSYQNLALKALM